MNSATNPTFREEDMRTELCLDVLRVITEGLLSWLVLSLV